MGDTSGTRQQKPRVVRHGRRYTSVWTAFDRDGLESRRHMVLPRPLCRCKARAQGLTMRAPAGTIRACITCRCPFEDARADRAGAATSAFFIARFEKLDVSATYLWSAPQPRHRATRLDKSGTMFILYPAIVALSAPARRRDGTRCPLIFATHPRLDSRTRPPLVR